MAPVFVTHGRRVGFSRPRAAQRKLTVLGMEVARRWTLGVACEWGLVGQTGLRLGRGEEEEEEAEQVEEEEEKGEEEEEEEE